MNADFHPFFAEGTEAMLALEGMVDRAGLYNLLCALEIICADKAEHIAHNWQDPRLAKAWANASIAVSDAAGNPSIIAVSP